jgi:hypothetical protein
MRSNVSNLSGAVREVVVGESKFMVKPMTLGVIGSVEAELRRELIKDFVAAGMSQIKAVMEAKKQHTFKVGGESNFAESLSSITGIQLIAKYCVVEGKKDEYSLQECVGIFNAIKGDSGLDSSETAEDDKKK